MEFYAFNLMPYRHLDMAAAKKNRSLWIDLPNKLYDPEVGAALYQEYIDQMIYAAEIGFDGICVNEHHQTAYGMMPAPNLVASIFIDRTRGTNVKIPVIGRALPLVNNPLNIAEEFAMLDNLSKGRLIAGFVRGIGCEYHAAGINPSFSLERFQEAHDLIVQAWTKEGPFSFEGEHYNYQYVNPWPRPYQRPGPEIWIPSQGSGETISWAAHPSRRYPFIITFSPAAAVLKYHAQYKERAQEFGYEASNDQLGWALPTYVAETDEIARKEARAHIETLFNDFLSVPLEELFPPGYTSIASLSANLAMRQGMVLQKQTMESLIEKGTFIVGSPDTVASKIKEVQSESGFNKLIVMFQFGTLPDQLVRKNLQCFAEEVMPKLRQ